MQVAKIAKLCFKTTNAQALGSFDFLPLRGVEAQALLAYCHFHSFLIFQKTLHMLKIALECTGYSIHPKIESQGQTITRTIFSQNQLIVSIHKEGAVVNRFLTAQWHFWTSWWEQTHCMEKGQLVFFLSPHTPYGHLKLTIFTCVRLLLSYSKLILRRKPNYFAV